MRSAECKPAAADPTLLLRMKAACASVTDGMCTQAPACACVCVSGQGGGPGCALAGLLGGTADRGDEHAWKNRQYLARSATTCRRCGRRIRRHRYRLFHHGHVPARRAATPATVRARARVCVCVCGAFASSRAARLMPLRATARPQPSTACESVGSAVQSVRSLALADRISVSLPHLPQDWGSPLPHLPQDWAHPCRICLRTGRAWAEGYAPLPGGVDW